MVGVSGPRAVLLWTDATGRAAHSVAPSTDLIGEGVVFDYFGAYTEMPAAYSVSVDVAVAAAAEYRGDRTSAGRAHGDGFLTP